MGRTKYDWIKIELRYVSGDMSIRELAEEFHVPFDTLTKRARSGKYTEKRDQYRSEVIQKAVKMLKEDDARELGKLLSATAKAIRVLEKYIDDDATIHSIITNGTEIRMDKADTKAIRNLSGALRDVAWVFKILHPDGTAEPDENQGVVLMPERE